MGRETIKNLTGQMFWSGFIVEKKMWFKQKMICFRVLNGLQTKRAKKKKKIPG